MNMMTEIALIPNAPSCASPAYAGPCADTRARVIHNAWVNDGYKHLVLDAGLPAANAAAGQFFHLLCQRTEAHQPFFRRPMSTYRADPSSGQVEFLYKVTGDGTRALASLAPGDGLMILGPLGRGFTLDPTWRRIVVLGRGVGLATLAPLAEAAAALKIGVTAILSARSRAYLMSQARFAALGATLIEVLDDDGSSGVPQLDTRLRELAAHGRMDALVTCGSNRLTQLAKRLCAELTIPGQVALEQQMACGLGMCYCCVRAFDVHGQQVSKRVCWDGPVFDIAEVPTCAA